MHYSALSSAKGKEGGTGAATSFRSFLPL